MVQINQITCSPVKRIALFFIRLGANASIAITKMENSRLLHFLMLKNFGVTVFFQNRYNN